MRIYTSESVSVGHPDKLADQISDALLDAFFENERPEARGETRVAIETLLTRGVAVVAGEVRTEGYVDIAKVVRKTIAEAGYTDTAYGFDGNTCGVLVAIQEQSADIAQGVDIGERKARSGAGRPGHDVRLRDARDAGVDAPPHLHRPRAHREESAEVRKSQLGAKPMLLPDAKSQVSVEYGEDGRPVRIDTIVLSQQHVADLELTEVQQIVRNRIIDPVLAQFAEYVKDDTILANEAGHVEGKLLLHINPTGKFVIGGPQGDTGVTGRKIIVDTYGGLAPHGGGAFSGKDPTKVDRSAAYMARHAAKNVVAAGLAERCVVQLAYAIGVAEPVAVNIETFGTETVDPATISKRVREAYNLTPQGIIDHLGLLDGFKYLQTAKNGHFGNPAFPWERTEDAAALR